MPFRFATCCIRRVVPEMMIRPNYGVSPLLDVTFDLSSITSLLQNILTLSVTLFGGKVSVLTRPLVKGSPDFLNPVYARDFHGLFPFIIAIVHKIFVRRATHIAIFFAVAMAWIDLSEILRSQKRFGIVSPDKIFE